ncbi:MAG: metalloregulator ArsR/SmtB family transcription factor [Methanobacteriota archaeon]
MNNVSIMTRYLWLNKKEKAKDKEFEKTSKIFDVLSNPTRLKMAYLLCTREICNCEIKKLLKKEQTLISHYLRDFKKAGMLQERRHGRWRRYSIKDEKIKALLDLME